MTNFEVIFSWLPSFLTLRSVWKPLRGPLYDWPLAMCDAATVSDQDIMAHDQVFLDTVRENQMIQHNPSQSWYYLAGQTQSELLVFRQVDSEHNQGTKHPVQLKPLVPINLKPTNIIIYPGTILFADPVPKAFHMHPFLFLQVAKVPTQLYLEKASKSELFSTSTDVLFLLFVQCFLRAVPLHGFQRDKLCLWCLYQHSAAVESGKRLQECDAHYPAFHNVKLLI